MDMQRLKTNTVQFNLLSSSTRFDPEKKWWIDVVAKNTELNDLADSMFETCEQIKTGTPLSESVRHTGRLN